MNFSVKTHLLNAILIAIGVALDQISKRWARATFSLPTDEPDPYHYLPALGEWIRFRLVYNSGAAFGLKPHLLIPGIHPTLFFGIISVFAIGFLLWFYIRIHSPQNHSPRDWASSLGTVCILSGAFGNLIDRLMYHRVTDFIDVGLPGVDPRWPTFNFADSYICVGVFLVILAPWFTKNQVTIDSSREFTG